MSDDPALAQRAPVHPLAAPADTAPADTHAVFVELVCADVGLLQVEFDALIAANFPPGNGRRSRRPPRRPGPPRIDRARPSPQAIPSSRSGPRSPSGTGTGTAHAARERGPPRQHPRRRFTQESRPATRR